MIFNACLHLSKLFSMIFSSCFTFLRTLLIDFNKPVLALETLNAEIVGFTQGGKRYFLRSLAWNANLDKNQAVKNTV